MWRGEEWSGDEEMGVREGRCGEEIGDGEMGVREGRCGEERRVAMRRWVVRGGVMWRSAVRRVEMRRVEMRNEVVWRGVVMRRV